LQKDRTLRLQHIGDARLELDDAAHPTPGGRHINHVDSSGVALVDRRGCDRGPRRWSLESACRNGDRAREPVTTLQFAIAPPPQATFGTHQAAVLASRRNSPCSPDGGTLVFVADSGKGPQLWHRSLSAVDARVLPGTDGAAFPFWSPDSQSVGFFADGKLKRIRIDGGPSGYRLRRRAGTGRHVEREQRDCLCTVNHRSIATCQRH
jgi:hypothetical protein